MNRKRLATLVALAVSIPLYPLLRNLTHRIIARPANVAIIPSQGWTIASSPNLGAEPPRGPMRANAVWVLASANAICTPTWTQLSPAGVDPWSRRNHTNVYDPSPNFWAEWNDPLNRVEISMPKPSLATNTFITNQATIVFDVNRANSPPTWINTIGNTPPVSQVVALPSTESARAFNVDWSGTDVGTGIQDFSIYVSDNGGPFMPFERNTNVTTDTTPPVTTAVNTPASNANGWNNTDVVVSLSSTEPGWYELSSSSLLCDECRIAASWHPSPAPHGKSQTRMGPEPHWSVVLVPDGNQKNNNGSIAWAHFDVPGTLEISVTSTGAGKSHGTAIARELSRREVLSRMRDISFDGLIVSIYLLQFAVLSSLWILSVLVLRSVAFWAIRRLPPRERTFARKEIKVLLRVAEWGGVGSYAIWTIGHVVQFAVGNGLLLQR